MVLKARARIRGDESSKSAIRIGIALLARSGFAFAYVNRNKKHLYAEHVNITVLQTKEHR